MVNFEKHRPKGIATGTVIKILLALIVIVGLGTIVVAESEWLQDILESIGFPELGPSQDDMIAMNSVSALAWAIDQTAIDSAKRYLDPENPLCCFGPSMEPGGGGSPCECNYINPTITETFSDTNVICDAEENGHTECTVTNFWLPQKVSDPEKIILQYGDPKYLTYWQNFPKGEEASWAGWLGWEKNSLLFFVMAVPVGSAVGNMVKGAKIGTKATIRSTLKKIIPLRRLDDLPDNAGFIVRDTASRTAGRQALLTEFNAIGEGLSYEAKANKFFNDVLKIKGGACGKKCYGAILSATGATSLAAAAGDWADNLMVKYNNPQPNSLVLKRNYKELDTFPLADEMKEHVAYLTRNLADDSMLYLASPCHVDLKVYKNSKECYDYVYDPTTEITNCETRNLLEIAPLKQYSDCNKVSCGCHWCRRLTTEEASEIHSKSSSGELPLRTTPTLSCGWSSEPASACEVFDDCYECWIPTSENPCDYISPYFYEIENCGEEYTDKPEEYDECIAVSRHKTGPAFAPLEGDYYKYYIGEPSAATCNDLSAVGVTVIEHNSYAPDSENFCFSTPSVEGDATLIGTTLADVIMFFYPPFWVAEIVIQGVGAYLSYETLHASYWPEHNPLHW